MDQMQRSNDGFGNLFGTDSSQQFQAYDNSFLNGTDPNFNDASWGLNASGYNPNPSRAQQQPVTSWQQDANHLSPSAHGNQATPYARSLSHSPAPFGQQNAFGGYAPQQNYQYQQQPYDPALYNTSNAGRDFNSNFAGYGNQGQNLGTIAPQALQQEGRSPHPTANTYGGVNYAQNAFGQSRIASASIPNSIDQHAVMSTIPKAVDNGYFSTIDLSQMVRATNSERMGNYLNIGKEVQDWPVNRTTTLPQYVSRKSKNELRKLVGNDANLLAKIGRKSIKKERIFSSAQTPAQIVAAAKGQGDPSDKIKYEGDTSSSEESEDDDDSSYTSDEDLEGSPLPNKRPEDMKGAVEYDTIKALWRSKRKSVDGADIRKGMVDFWEIVKTIRDRWKTDSAAVTQAEEKKRVGELPLLKSRVKDQRDMIEVAFKAALKHGNRSIVELLAENAALDFLCYQFLLDRFKADDLNGPLSRVILELMTLFTTLDNTILEKVHLDKVLPRFIKKGDAKTQYFAKRISANAAAVTKEKAAAPPPASKPATATKTTSAASPPTKRAEPEPVAGVKRSASSTPGDGGAQKKVATGVTKTNGVVSAAKPTGIVKKTATATGSAKPAAAAVPATKTKQVTAKPSSFFSSLQSAAKKPGTSIKTGTPAQAAGTKAAEKKATSATATVAPKPAFSFAETMANLSKPKEQKPTTTKPEKELPPETAEQKAKRLRKEARRKMHVSFKMGEDLVQVRYFTHDPEEEMGHDDSQMRDMADAGGEGRALKLHQDSMEIDEEDEEETEQPLIEFKTPSLIDFSVVDEEERNRNYARFGGKLEPESAERAAREQYEANTLIVFYTDEKDIPANPREPTDPYSGEQATSGKHFGAPDEKFAARARARKAAKAQRYPTVRPPFDMSALNQFVNTQQQQPTTASLDLQKLLAQLQPAQPAVATPPPMMGYGAPAPAPTMAQPPAHPQQNGQQIDLAAILAAINPQGAAAQQPQMGAFGGPPMMGFMPQQPQMGGGGDGNDSESAGQKRWRDKGGDNRFFKTKVCRYWQEGRCMKGDGCTYLHEEAPAS